MVRVAAAPTHPAVATALSPQIPYKKKTVSSPRHMLLQGPGALAGATTLGGSSIQGREQAADTRHLQHPSATAAEAAARQHGAKCSQEPGQSCYVLFAPGSLPTRALRFCQNTVYGGCFFPCINSSSSSVNWC